MQVNKASCGVQDMGSAAQRKFAFRRSSSLVHPLDKTRARQNGGGGHGNVLLGSWVLLELYGQMVLAKCTTQNPLIGKLVAESARAGRNLGVKGGNDAGMPPGEEFIEVAHLGVEIIIAGGTNAEHFEGNAGKVMPGRFLICSAMWEI